MVTNSAKVLILSLGPMDEHQAALADILTRADWPSDSATSGRLHICSGVDSLLPLMRKNRIPIVLCDSEWDWRQLLDRIGELPQPPHVIVTSRLADDRLWSEALNLGAYDVLAKPFDTNEVIRVLTMAWRRWHER